MKARAKQGVVFFFHCYYVFGVTPTVGVTSGCLNTYQAFCEWLLSGGGNPKNNHSRS